MSTVVAPRPAAPATAPAPAVTRRRARRAPVSRAVRVSQAVVALFLLVEVLIALAPLNGPFLDESIYVVAGHRTLDGHGAADYYLTWFAGSLLWPALAGAADALGGLAGARVLAALCVAISVAAVVRTSGILFGDATRPWTALVAVTNGALVALGHLAVYDALALVGVAGGVLAVAELDRSDDRRWTVAIGAALALAALAKYPALAFAGLPLTVLVVTLRGRKAVLDLGLVAFVTVAGLLCFFLPERQQLARFVSFRVDQNPNFGITDAMIGFQLAYFAAVPLLLGLVGLLHAERRHVVWPLLLGPLAPVLYHLGSHTAVGLEKHVVYAVVLVAPLAGLALSRGWARGPLRRVALVGAVAGLAALAAVQVDRNDHSWVDVRPSVAFLQHEVRPGQRLLVDDSWPYVQGLLSSGDLASPFDVYDVYRVANGQAGRDLCRYDWFVESPGSSSWPASVRRQVAACGTFERVFATTDSKRVALGNDLRFFTFSSTVVVYRNTRS